MSYQANLDIVIAMDKLQISSFKKQGTIRFKITLFTSHPNSLENKNQDVTDHLHRTNILTASAALIMSTKLINNLFPCFSSFIKTKITNPSSKYGTQYEYNSKKIIKTNIKIRFLYRLRLTMLFLKNFRITTTIPNSQNRRNLLFQKIPQCKGNRSYKSTSQN